jgi:hypothetical protein
MLTFAWVTIRRSGGFTDCDAESRTTDSRVLPVVLFTLAPIGRLGNFRQLADHLDQIGYP